MFACSIEIHAYQQLNDCKYRFNMKLPFGIHGRVSERWASLFSHESICLLTSSLIQYLHTCSQMAKSPKISEAKLLLLLFQFSFDINVKAAHITTQPTSKDISDTRRISIATEVQCGRDPVFFLHSIFDVLCSNAERFSCLLSVPFFFVRFFSLLFFFDSILCCSFEHNKRNETKGVSKSLSIRPLHVGSFSSSISCVIKKFPFSVGFFSLLLLLLFVETFSNLSLSVCELPKTICGCGA